MKLKDACPWKESNYKPRQGFKRQRHHFSNKGLYSQSYGFSSSPLQMWELDHKEGWVPKNWCFRTVVLKNLEIPLDCKEIKPINPKGNQSWMFIGRTDAEVEAPILWAPGTKRQLIGTDWRLRVWQRMKWLAGILDSMDMNLSKLREIVKEREACHATALGVAKSRTWLNDWTTTTPIQM